jgi:pyruvate dehydrogenase E1 component alpha subunit
LPIAVGYAVSLKRAKKNSVVVVECGDGESNEGNFYEAMNLAAIMEAPIVFFIVNNGIAFTNLTSNTTKLKDLSYKAMAAGIPGVTVDGQDILAVREAVENAIEKARAGQPSLVEAKTARYDLHGVGLGADTRPPEEIARLKSNDPIERYEKFLVSIGLLNDQKISEIKKKSHDYAMEGFDFAIASPNPTKEDVYDINLVYKNNGGDLL